LEPSEFQKRWKPTAKRCLPAPIRSRVSAQSASPDAKGQTASLERWAEFLQAGQVKGREVVVIVPQSDTATVMKDAPPKPNGFKFELLKGNDYSRLWINKAGTQYVVYFPTA
jgi:hypothetical protein